MSSKVEGGYVKTKNKGDRKSSLFKPVFVFFICVFIFVAGIYLLSKSNQSKGKTSIPSDFFKSEQIFSIVDKNITVPFVIKFRKDLDKGKIHRVQFRVEVSNGFNQQQLMAIAQKIVKQTLTHEYCHGITIDFGCDVYIDFAPFGNWAKAGEVPINNYKNYRFKCFFPSS